MLSQRLRRHRQIGKLGFIFCGLCIRFVIGVYGFVGFGDFVAWAVRREIRYTGITAPLEVSSSEPAIVF